MTDERCWECWHYGYADSNMERMVCNCPDFCNNHDKFITDEDYFDGQACDKYD